MTKKAFTLPSDVGGFLGPKEEKQHKAANVKRQALLNAAAHEAQDQTEQPQGLA